MARRHVKAARVAAVSALTAVVAAACSSITGTGGTTANLTGASGSPIRIGISLPLTGDFAADGQASRDGYELWASDVNAHGGLLGRHVSLVIRDDKSDPAITAKDYQALIASGVNLTMAPFSSLLTVAAAQVTDQHHYVLTAGSASAPKVYQLQSHWLFSTNVPVETQMVPFANWVKTLPFGKRPTSAVYPMVNDPFADPPVQKAQQILSGAGIKTLAAPIYNVTSTAALNKDASAIAKLNADMVVLGSVDVPTVTAFIRTFASMNYNPKIFIASAGPDQGQAFISSVGTGNAPGVMVPNGWYGAFPNALSHVMVQSYIAKFGGTASDINADVAEAYSAGQTLAAGVTGAGTVSNQQLIAGWLHKNTVQTVLGAVRFDASGENLDALNSALIFQWQPGQHFLQVLPKGAPGSLPQPTFPKPPWGG